MAAIKFIDISYKNFLSTGDTFTTIKLNDTKSTLIVGTNGSGKSTMLDAISYALFGKPHRKINIPQLLNSVNSKRMLVVLNFTIGSVKYKIVRGIRPNVFEIWQNDKMLNQEAHASDYQKILENNILKMNHKSFHQIVVLGAGNFIPFMQLPAHHRRVVIEDLLDIGVFSRMLVLIKARLGTLKNEIIYNKSQIELTTEKINLQTKHIGELKAIDANNAKQIEDEIEELLFQVEELKTLNTELVEQARTDAEPTELTTLRKRLTSIFSELHHVKSDCVDAGTQMEFYEKNETCPTCLQDMDNDMRTGAISGLCEKRNTLRLKINELNGEMHEVEALIDKIETENKRILKINTSISDNNSRIIQIQAHIKKAQEKLSQRNGVDTTVAEAALTELYESLNDLKKENLRFNKVQAYCVFIEELLKDNGIKSKIIKQYLPIINKLINQYLTVLDFFVSFNIDENFNETIKSRHRDAFTYASFSEGEKSRLDLSMMFAWRQIARMKNSISTNLLVLDEVFDSSLDTEGADNLLKILSTLDSDTNVFVISHKTDILDGKFDRKIEFIKEGNFSKMYES